MILCACMGAVMTGSLESTIVATAVPTIAGDLGGFPLLGWIFAAYLLPQSVSIPMYGRLADQYGRRPVMFFGLSVFMAGSLLCGFAHSMPWLIVFRAVQGLGAGVLLPIGLTILGDVFNARERMRVQPYITVIFTASAMGGPLLGAFIIETASWPWIFWVTIPVALGSMGMLAAFFRDGSHRATHPIDVAGTALLTTALTFLLLAVLRLDRLDLWLLVWLAAAAVAMVGFLRQERRAQEPLLPEALWRDPVLLGPNLCSFVIGAVSLSTTAMLPTYLQALAGSSVLQAGVVIAAMFVSWTVGSILSSQLALRSTYRVSITTGTFLFSVGAVLLPVMAILSGDGDLPLVGSWWPVILAVLIGCGCGACNNSSQICLTEWAGPKVRGISTAAFVFMRALGGTLGTAVLSTILNIGLADCHSGVAEPVQTLIDDERAAQLAPEVLSRLTASVSNAFHAAFIAGAVFALLGFVGASMIPRGVRPGEGGQRGIEGSQ